jgi:hypothetical protein
MAKGEKAAGQAAQKKSANAAKIYDPTVIDLETGANKEIVFKLLNPNNRYMKGSLKNAKLRERIPPQAQIPAVSRVRYFFSDEEKSLAEKEGRKMPESTVLTAFYKNGQAGYVEDLDYVNDPKEFMQTCEPILFSASPDYDASLTPILIVRPEQEELLWYLRTCSYNEGSIYRSTEHIATFYEFKPTEIARRSLETNKVSVKAQGRFVAGLEHADKEVRDAVWTQHLAIASSFGVDITRNPAEVERDILFLLDKNPSAFIEASQNPANYMIFILRMAERTGVISLDRNTNTFRWGNNKSAITSFAQGTEPFAEFAKWLQRTESEATYAKIKELWEQSNSKGFGNYNAAGLAPEIMVGETV